VDKEGGIVLIVGDEDDDIATRRWQSLSTLSEILLKVTESWGVGIVGIFITVELCFFVFIGERKSVTLEEHPTWGRNSPTQSS